MKRAISFFTTFVCSVTFAITVFAAPVIDDGIPYGKEALRFCIERGYFAKILNDNVTAADVTQPATREQLFSIVVTATNATKTAEKLPFSDTSSIADDFLDKMSIAYASGYLSGASSQDGLLANPKSNVTRAELAAIISRVLSLKSTKTIEVEDFNSIPTWAVGAVSACYEYKIMVGDGRIWRPMDNVSLLEIAQIIFNLAERQLLLSGEVKNFAGMGRIGYINGAAKSSTFAYPSSIAFNNEGQAAVVDAGNNLVRLIADSKVTTIAGTSPSLSDFGKKIKSNRGTLNNPQYAVYSKDGDLYISNTGSNEIKRLSKGGLSTFAEGLASPTGLACDNEYIYVCDTGNNLIKKFDLAGKLVTSYGTGTKGYLDGSTSSSQFNEPMGIAVENGVIYVADTGNQRIRKIENDRVTTIAGNGTLKDEAFGYIIGGYYDGSAAHALFNFPTGIWVENGVVFIADTENSAVRLLSNGNVSTVAGDGSVGSAYGVGSKAQFNTPTDVKLYKGTLYVVDSINCLIKTINIK